jgi:NAD(P)-dependent dehydrogenase (short-subunit alcohol dehydrogenase family)
MTTQHAVHGKVVAITGAARGIGYATAKRLLEEGAVVAIGDIDEAQLKQAADELGITAYGPLDVTDPESFAAFLDLVERQLGALDVLVNNAGIMPTGPFAEETDKTTRRQVEINVLGVMYGSKLALQRMLPRRNGHIINISSMAGDSYAPGLATYCATKHAAKAFTEALRREVRHSGVDVSCVMPTYVKTQLIEGTGHIRLFQPIEPEQIADAILGLVVKPKPQVRVSRLAGAISKSQIYLPRVIVEPLTRALGGEKAFTNNLDTAARRSYTERIDTN